MDFWEQVKTDLQKGVMEGLDAVKEGAAKIRKKATELTAEGKRHYNLYELQSKVQKDFAELGGRVYNSADQGMDPMADRSIRRIIARIKRYEAQIERLSSRTVPGRRPQKRVPPSGRRTAARPSAGPKR